MNTLIPKVIHISWKDKTILENKHVFNQNCLLNLESLNTGWKIEISTDQDIDDYLRRILGNTDYNLIKDKHIVEKSDLWRLLKLYLEGGLYVDIDRLCNKKLDDVLKDETKCLLPTCLDHDFSQDFMCSASGNPIFETTIQLTLQRRYEGHENVYFLGPQSYMHGITKVLFGEMIDVNPPIEVFTQIRTELEKMPFMQTFREYPPCNTVLFEGNLDFDYELEKKNFYHEYNLKHWTNAW